MRYGDNVAEAKLDVNSAPLSCVVSVLSDREPPVSYSVLSSESSMKVMPLLASRHVLLAIRSGAADRSELHVRRYSASFREASMMCV